MDLDFNQKVFVKLALVLKDVNTAIIVQQLDRLCDSDSKDIEFHLRKHLPSLSTHQFQQSITKLRQLGIIGKYQDRKNDYTLNYDRLAELIRDNPLKSYEPGGE